MKFSLLPWIIDIKVAVDICTVCHVHAFLFSFACFLLNLTFEGMLLILFLLQWSQWGMGMLPTLLLKCDRLEKGFSWGGSSYIKIKVLNLSILWHIKPKTSNGMLRLVSWNRKVVYSPVKRAKVLQKFITARYNFFATHRDVQCWIST